MQSAIDNWILSADPEDFTTLSKHLNKKVTEEILQKTRKVVKWLKRTYLQEK
jgi:hypothetical protein